MCSFCEPRKQVLRPGLFTKYKNRYRRLLTGYYHYPCFNARWKYLSRRPCELVLAHSKVHLAWKATEIIQGKS